MVVWLATFLRRIWGELRWEHFLYLPILRMTLTSLPVLHDHVEAEQVACTGLVSFVMRNLLVRGVLWMQASITLSDSFNNILLTWICANHTFTLDFSLQIHLNIVSLTFYSLPSNTLPGDENFRSTFAVSTLTPSIRSTPLSCLTYTPPPVVLLGSMHQNSQRCMCGAVGLGLWPCAVLSCRGRCDEGVVVLPWKSEGSLSNLT